MNKSKFETTIEVGEDEVSVSVEAEQKGKDLTITIIDENGKEIDYNTLSAPEQQNLLDEISAKLK